MKFTYKISPFAYLRYYMYWFKWPVLLISVLLCTRLTPLEGQNPVLSYLIYYVLYVIAFLIFFVPIGVIVSILIAVIQGQAGKISTVLVDADGITERWQDKSIFIPWDDIKKKTIHRNLIVIRSKKIHWHIFRNSAGYQNFEELKDWIKKYTDPPYGYNRK